MRRFPGYARLRDAMKEYPSSVDELLCEARGKFDRLSPQDAQDAVSSGALLIDIRSDIQRWEDGGIPGAHRVQRNVLEWRLDPSSPHRDTSLARRDSKVILLCDEGYQSSLGAATLCGFGMDATDVVGGFRAWRDQGLPVEKAESHPGASG
jgi:rhodanese-related sulfurtransferase